MALLKVISKITDGILSECKPVDRSVGHPRKIP